MREKCPPVARVQELLTIDPAEGVLRWKAGWSGWRKAGEEAGARTNDASPGYGPHWIIRVGVDLHDYGAHNLAWVLYYGACPSKLVDHIDGNSLNNRKVNLRLASHSQNVQNSKRYRNNILEIKGVKRHKKVCNGSDGITARIKLNGKTFSKTLCISKWGEKVAIERVTEWRRTKTLELHQDFGNHGEQSVVIDREAGTWAVS